MRESKFLVILVVVSIFAIIISLAIFYVKKNQGASGELTENTVVEDDSVTTSENSVSVSKTVGDYNENTTSTSSSNNASENNSSNSSEESNTQTQTVEQSSPSIPQIPTVASVPYSTDKDAVSVEVTGEPNAEIFINDWSQGFLDANGKKTISLNTAGGDGDKFFGILLKNQAGKSGSLNVTIKKVTTTSAISSSNNTTSNSKKTTWAYVYTNKQKFDIDDYRDDDIEELKLKNICDRDVETYCYKTSNLGDENNSNLGNTKCPNNCSKNQTCLLWNKIEKSSGSIYSWTALYKCEYKN